MAGKGNELERYRRDSEAGERIMQRMAGDRIQTAPCHFLKEDYLVTFGETCVLKIFGVGCYDLVLNRDLNP
jgi:hypothetical protein